LAASISQLSAPTQAAQWEEPVILQHLEQLPHLQEQPIFNIVGIIHVKIGCSTTSSLSCGVASNAFSTPALSSEKLVQKNDTEMVDFGIGGSIHSLTSHMAETQSPTQTMMLRHL
jgi:hypothetical protein